MKKILYVALNTSKEIFRDRILYGLIIFAVFLLLLSLLLGELTFTEQARIITNMGMFAAQVGCCMLAIFVGSSLVWREIDRQTVLTLLSKPISRSYFILGKFLGLAIVIIVADLLISLMLAAVCLSHGTIHWSQFVVSEIGILFESLFLLSVSLFFGVFARPVLTTLFTLSVWLMGHAVSDLRYFSDKSSNILMHSIGSILAKILPNLESFSFKEAVIYGDSISADQIIQAAVLWFAWSVLLFIATTSIFKRRDFT